LAREIETAMRTGSTAVAPAIESLPDDGQAPLSYAQQRLWLLNQLMPGSNAYNLPAEILLDVQKNIGALRQALTEVLRRHEALRTTFVIVGSNPVQRIQPPAPVALPLVDLRRLNPDAQHEQAARLTQESSLRAFDLEVGPLVRAALVRSETHWLFLLNMHHIVSDGWSMSVLLHEMETLYDAYSRGVPSPLPELEVQYADYARWQRNWLKDEALKEQVDFWRRQLEGVPTLLELETDHPRHSLRNVRGAQHPIRFSEEVSECLRRFHLEEGATLFMTLMAGFHALLWRYTGQSDILVGTPIAGRSQVQLESLIGFFVNMIPIRTSFTDAPTFRELVRQVRDASLAAYTHQELPFDKLVEELQPRRSAGRNPIFQTILAVQNAAPQMSVAKVELPAGVPASADVKFDLEVHLRDTPDGVKGAFVYSPELYEPAFIARMAGHFERLFEQAMLAPDSDLSTLSLLNDAEYREVVEEWNDTAALLPEGCIHDVFLQQVEERPDAIAIEFGDEQITYRALDQQANHLAHRLRGEGVGAETFVGVMLERSAELVMSLLAVAKAGGVYVPINLTDPERRIDFVLQDASVTALATTRALAKRLERKDISLVCVEELSEGSADNLRTNLNPDLSLDNLAYLMYTSGSTGTPKGVGITHRNVLRLVKGANYADLNPAEVFLQFAPVSFDASTFEIWGALLNGARLVVFPPDLPSIAELADFIDEKQVTTLWLTSGLFHQLADGGVSGLATLKQLLAGGDALSPSHVRKAIEHLPGCKLINGYGPTETTTFACCYEIGTDIPESPVPIGSPISNTTAYVLNALQPSGIGERGELFIGGKGLARGYHQRPDLTAERFLPNPFGVGPGERLYRTGDAARYRNDGAIQFLGRIDDQVKISGFRIEPREIEAVLSTHPALSGAVVVVRENTQGQKFLVAYVVSNSAPSNDDLRAYLKERLPEYMVPAAFVPLEALPLTPNGKIDRAALPAPPTSLTSSRREYVAPRNDLQRQLVDIWEELLKLHPIGITDSFFELSGTSFQLVMLVMRIQERLGKRITMAELSGEPTIERLAELLGYYRESIYESLIVPLHAQGTKPVLFAPHASGGNVWCYKELVQHVGDDQPFYGLQPREAENGLVYHTEIEAMAADYVRAIRALQPTGPYWLIGWSMGGVIAFEMACQLRQQGQQVALLALIDAAPPEVEYPEFTWGLLLSTFASDLGLTFENLSRSIQEMAALPQMTQLRQVWMDTKRAGVVPSDMTFVEFRKLFDTFKVNAHTVRRYRPGAFDGRITLFSAAQDHNGRRVSEPRFLKEWTKLTTHGVDAQIIPGDHFAMIRQPHVNVLAERLQNCIQQTLQNSRY
jgi:aspartate racemase